MDASEVLLDQRKRTAAGKRWVERKPRGLKRFALTKVARGDGADLPTVDMRSMLGRRYREIAVALIGDAGGLDRCSAIKLHLIRRFAACAAFAEKIEARAVDGKEIDTTQYAIFVGALTRLARLLGTGRVPVEVPSLEEYLAQRRNGDAAQAPPIEGEAVEGDVIDDDDADDDADGEL
jgi:hypothetical protein